ncbi:BolA family transcriptional regulator [Alginatibacterium sediminis]|uniref:BolA family transcriptional regulator n=1 Tax=Alginatibacterium sediminis TaxID=2164068 RepID=A0A420E967_9ALTE|nr:BolA family protein [Alginatibacterium sediminis]RKF15911.1 BolA family transcriptional regulator [Alginatibacterium sediminis]
MLAEQIQEILESNLELEYVRVQGEGNHFNVIAVGLVFEGLNRVKQQQAVYAPLTEYIASNEIHALTIKAFTPKAWQDAQKFGQV